MSDFLKYDELPANVARHYYEEDIKYITLTEYPEEKTAVMMIRVKPVKPRPNMTDGVHRWQRFNGDWEFTG